MVSLDGFVGVINVTTYDSSEQTNIVVALAKLEVMEPNVNGSHKKVLRNLAHLPTEILIEIFRALDKSEHWSLAHTCNSIYNICKTHFLFKRVCLGWSVDEMSKVANDDGFSIRLKESHRDISNNAVKLLSDLRFIRKYRVGNLVREAKLCLYPPEKPLTNSKDDVDIVGPLIALFSSLPNLVHAELCGRNQKENLIETIKVLGTYCNLLSSLSIHWLFDNSSSKRKGGRKAHMPTRFLDPHMFPALRTFKVFMHDYTWVDDSDDKVSATQYTRIYNIVEPILQFCGITLRELDLDVDDHDYEIVLHLSRFAALCSNLRVLKYHYNRPPGFGGQNRSEIDVMCSSLKSLEKIYLFYEPWCIWTMSDAVFQNLPVAFSQLTKCTFVHIGLNIPADYRSQLAILHQGHVDDLKDKIFERRKGIILRIGKTMPALRCIEWPYHGGIYQQEVRMSVERNRMGQPMKFNFIIDCPPCDWNSGERFTETVEVQIDDETDSSADSP